VRNDTELTQVEDLTNRSTVAVWLAAAMAMVLLHLHHPVTAAGRVCGLGVLAGSAAVLAASVLRRRRR
jgi:hypothetical protein